MLAVKILKTFRSLFYVLMNKYRHHFRFRNENILQAYLVVSANKTQGNALLRLLKPAAPYLMFR